jgi:hypothetical protein
MGRTELIENADIRQMLDNYAERGLFREVTANAVDGNRSAFQFRWHYGRRFDLLVDHDAPAVAFVGMFPDVLPDSPLFRDVSAFIMGLADSRLAPHRRVDPARVRLTCESRDGDLTIFAASIDGNIDYATRKLIQAVNEVFFDFLPDSAHYHYQVEKLGLDPNAITFA